MRTSVKLEGVGAIIQGKHPDPATILGPHEVDQQGKKTIAVRAFVPDAKQVWIEHSAHSRPQPMRKLHPGGFYEVFCNARDDSDGRPYALKIVQQNGETTTMHDPYSFPSFWTEFDLHLFGEGQFFEAYNKFGAQVCELNGVRGVNFSVWAPNAQKVSLVGDFNQWDSRRHAMKKLVPSGIWEIFLPDVEPGMNYKYRIIDEWGQSHDKSDPFGFAAELPPKTASVVSDLTQHEWGDEDWIKRRAETNWLESPVSVFEVHLGSWKNDGDGPNGWMNYRELAHQLVDYCLDLGFTHLELMPVSEHPFTGSWGYQTVGYFAATSRYGTPEDFMYFVDYCHQHGIGVILDWVPAHFPRDAHGLRRFDGSALYEHADPRQGEHPDWGTMIFNYGRNEVRNFLISNALFWFDKYHIDGLRVDAVASMLYLDYSRKEGEWIPNQHGGRENIEAISLLKIFNEQSHARFPGVLTVAEESTAWGGVSRPTDQGGLGFSMKWNMGWMNDTLRYIHEDPVHRRYHHDELTFSLIYAFTENFVLPFSHDEVVHGKGAMLDQMPGDMWQKFANLRLLYTYMWMHPGKKLLFMGSEFAQWNEWNHDTSLQWDLLQWDTHKGVRTMVGDLNKIYQKETALHELDFDGAGFEWIDCMSADISTLAWLRKGKTPGDFVVVCCNFTPVVRDPHRIGVPEAGQYEVIFNSDSTYYDGGNVGTPPVLTAEKIGAHGRPYSIETVIPPLAGVIYKPKR